MSTKLRKKAGGFNMLLSGHGQVAMNSIELRMKINKRWWKFENNLLSLLRMMM